MVLLGAPAARDVVANGAMQKQAGLLAKMPLSVLAAMKPQIPKGQGVMRRKKPSLRLMHLLRPSVAYRDFCPHLPALNNLPGTAEPCSCDLHCRIQLSLAAMRFHLQKCGPDGSTAQFEVPGHSGLSLQCIPQRWSRSLRTSAIPSSRFKNPPGPGRWIGVTNARQAQQRCCHLIF